MVINDAVVHLLVAPCGSAYAVFLKCGVDILDFLGMNLKSIHINHGHPATMKVSDYISPKYQSTSVISCGYFGAVELLFSVI